MRAIFRRVEENGGLLFSLIFWFTLYSAGRHPDVTWGDSLGYALAIRNGYDLSINANSHFLYLNFHRFMMNWTGIQDSMAVLSWASVVWSLATLYVVYLIGKLLKNKETGLLSLHMLAVLFPFWRQACIIEVYAMELFFWALLVFNLVKWYHTHTKIYLGLAMLVHAVGLLVHIHFMLFFPVLVFMLFRSRTFPAHWFLVYLGPVCLVTYLTYFLKINSPEEVFFDTIRQGMLNVSLVQILCGAGMVAFLWVAMFPVGLLILFARFSSARSLLLSSIRNPLAQSLFLQVIMLVAFCSMYPAFGIYVFLLPVFLMSALATSVVAQRFFHFSVYLKIAGIVVLQVCIYLTVNGLSASLLHSYLSKSIVGRGGPGYYVLPWARGNAPSLLEATRQNAVPEDLDWNRRQALEWFKLNGLKY